MFLQVIEINFELLLLFLSLYFCRRFSYVSYSCDYYCCCCCCCSDCHLSWNFKHFQL